MYQTNERYSGVKIIVLKIKKKTAKKIKTLGKNSGISQFGVMDKKKSGNDRHTSYFWK